MNLQSPRQSRAEQLIASITVAMAIAAVVKPWSAPSQPARHVRLARALLTSDAVYALILAFLAGWRQMTWRHLKPATHAFDGAVFAFATALTNRIEGPTLPSANVSYVTFSLVCATLCWQWYGRPGQRWWRCWVA
jgi:polyferredoxin